MRAALLSGPRSIEVVEIPTPQPGAGQALIRVEGNALCGSDLNAYLGQHPRRTYPAIIGHEICGIVVAVGPTADETLVGQRVVVEPNVSCGTCRWCRSDLPNVCIDYRVLGSRPENPGGCAEHVVVGVSQVHPLPSGINAEDGALVQHLAIAYEGVVRQGQVREGDVALVIGAGPIGLASASLAQLHGAQVIISDVIDRRLELAGEHGIGVTLRADDPGYSDNVLERTGGHGVDLCVEAVGGARSDLILTAQRLTARRGRIVTMGGFAESVLPFSVRDLKCREQSLIGAIGHPGTFGPVIDILASGQLPTAGMITRRIGLEGLGEVLAHMDELRDENMKVVVEPGADR